MINTEANEVGVAGLGYMGCSIAAAFLIWGYKVVGLAGLETDLGVAPGRIRHILEEAAIRGIHHQNVEVLLTGISFTKKHSDLKSCFLISENVLENLEVKREQLALIESAVSGKTIITTNTSAIPITDLQANLKIPGRFLGMHWAEPAFTSPYLEIICGPGTDPAIAESLYRLTSTWGKEPTLLRRDIRGFITNRLMYAMYREALYLVANGYTGMEDIDRACRNDAGRWMTFCGPFRYMDLTGFQAYYHVMKDLFPELTNQTEVPPFMENTVKEGGKGIFNGRGFYSYTEEEAEAWSNAFEEFRFAIHDFSKNYPADLVQRRLEKSDPPIKG